jgi:putative transposase
MLPYSRTTRIQWHDPVNGYCWDNAPAESFFASLKKELVHDEDYQTRAEATASIFEYIEVFYNRQRRHSTLGYVSPAEYEQSA